MRTNTIGIIGAGNIGSAFAHALANAGLTAVVANSRGPHTLKRLEQELAGRVRAVKRTEAAAQDMVLVAVPWSHVPAALADLPSFDGRVVIDANNPIEAPTFELIDLGGKLSSEVVASLAPGARLVKAFNHLPPPLLSANPQEAGGRRVLFYSGDDTDAKNQVASLMKTLGFAGIDLGPLAIGGRLLQFPGGPLAAQNLLRVG